MNEDIPVDLSLEQFRGLTPEQLVELTAGTITAKPLPRIVRPPREPKVVVYNPRHMRAQVPVGRDWVFVDARSEFEVVARIEPPRNEANDEIINRPGKATVSAQELAEQICSDDHFGKDGFVILSGLSAQERELAKEKANKVWDEKFGAQVLADIEAWEGFVRACREANQAPPEMEKRIKDAYAFRRSRRLEVQPMVICPVCAVRMLTLEEIAAHIEDEHPDTMVSEAMDMLSKRGGQKREKTLAEKAAAGEIEPAKVERTADEERARSVAAQAHEAKVFLTVADRKGLKHADPDVIRDIEARIKKAKK